MLKNTLPPNPDETLNVSITDELIDKHGLTKEEYKLIVGILEREPNLTELGVFSVMWSEHCSYKNSRPLLKGFPMVKKDKDAPGQVLIKAGEENAGVVDIGDGWAASFKIESHNHPSAIEPYEGAATGVGGIIRDIFTMGARPVLLTNSLRFGNPESKETRRLVRGVVHGIANYGNCMGIPNVGGDVYFDECYEGNPLVNALCLGILRHDEIKRGAAEGVGNPVYYVGAATGRDGLGGASFASKELTEESAEDRPAVQKGDPFMEKLLLEACLEMMAIPGLVVGIQDMGAAGLTCSTCETAARGGTGIEVELDKVPQREKDMNSYEILLSESQERMLVIVSKGREKELEAVFEKWDLHAAEVGVVTDTGKMLIKQHGVTVVDIPAAKLADDAPIYNRVAKEPAHIAKAKAWSPDSLPRADKAAVETALSNLLKHPTIASKQWIWRQYDHMVQAGTHTIPGADAGIVRIRTGNNTEKYLAIANDCNNRYCYLDPYRGAQIAFAECARNLACAGARPIGLTDNLNFGNPHKPDAFHMLKECVKGLADACSFFDVPVSGGNVSLYNENPDGPIDPTPTVSILGQIDHPEHIPTRWIPENGMDIILVGGLPTELGGSYYIQVAHGLKDGAPPQINLEHERNTHNWLIAEIESGRIAAAHDISEGGLLVAIAEMLFADTQTLGADITLGETPEDTRNDAALFGESQGRIILGCAPGNSDAVIKSAQGAGIEAARIGNTNDRESFVVQLSGDNYSWNINELRNNWENALTELLDE